jgi:hypothetical protein
MTIANNSDDNSLTMDKTRTALNDALKIFGEFSRLSAWRQLETEFRISPTGTKPLSNSEIEFALKQMFGDGSATVMKAYQQELARV